MNYFSDALARRVPFFYGYVMLPIAMLMQVGTSPGQTFAISAFTPALLVSLELSESRLALAYALGTVFAAIPLSSIGPISDRYGLRAVSIVVVSGLSAACYFASTVSGFATLLLAFFFLRFLGQGSLTLLSSNTTAMWFRTRIGRVSAIVSIGTAAAFAWVPGWISDAIDHYGWRATYQGLAVIVFGGLLPLLLLLYRNRPEDMGQSLDGTKPQVPGNSPAERTADAQPEDSLRLKEVLKTKTYYILGLTNAVWAMVGTGVLFYIYTFCSDRGFPESTASGLFKTFGLTMLAMQFAGNVLADFMRLNRLLGLGATALSVGLAILWYAPTPIAMHLFAGFFGGGQGLLIAVSGVAWVRFYGRDHLGSIRGYVWCAAVGGSGCGPLIMGLIKDSTGTYDLAIVIFIALMIPLSVASWFVQPPRASGPAAPPETSTG